MEVHPMEVLRYLQVKFVEFAHPLPRRTLTTSISWRRFLNSADCGLESPPWKISSDMDDIEVKDGESGGGIMCTRAGRGRGTGALSVKSG